MLVYDVKVCVCVRLLFVWRMCVWRYLEVCVCVVLQRDQSITSLWLCLPPLSPHCDFIFISACGNFISPTPLSTFHHAQFSPWGREGRIIPHWTITVEAMISFDASSVSHNPTQWYNFFTRSYQTDLKFSFYILSLDILAWIISLLAWVALCRWAWGNLLKFQV